MRKLYKKIENDIEYLVLESDDYYYINNYQIHGTLPEGYEDMKYTKYIKHDNDGRIDINYYYNNLQHNLYSPAFKRQYSFNIGYNYGEGHYIYGKGYSKEDWIKKSKIILREQKIKKILNSFL